MGKSNIRISAKVLMTAAAVSIVRNVHLKIYHRRVAHLIFLSVAMVLAGATQADEPMESEFAPPLSDFQRAAKFASRSSPLHARKSVLTIELPEVEEIRSKKSAERTAPTEIGFGRRLPKAYQGNLAPLLTWALREDGSYIAMIEITSPGAKGLRAGVRALAGVGVKLRFSDPTDSTATFPVFSPKSKPERWEQVQVHWSPTVNSDRLGIEIHAPNWNAATDMRLEIERISHVFLDLSAPLTPRATPESGRRSCENIPVACGRSSPCTVAATAKLSFVEPDGHAYVCTGTVINDDRESSDKVNNAFLHTAYHCIDSQGTAQSLEAEFHYAYESCTDSRLDSRYGRYFGGADLLEALPRHDQSLIRLRRPLSVGACALLGGIRTANRQTRQS